MYSENPKRAEIYRKQVSYERNQFRVVGENRRRLSAKRVQQNREDYRRGKGNRGHHANRLFYALNFFRAEIVADYRACAVREALHGNEAQLHEALHDRHRAHIIVAAEFLQSRIEHDENRAFGRAHYERGNSERGDFFHSLEFEPYDFRPQSYRAFFRRKENQNPRRARSLRDDCRHSRAAHSHSQDENENRVERDVQYRADKRGDHRGAGVSLARDERVQAEREQNENCSAQIDFKIFRSVGQGCVACSERHENRLPENEKRRAQDD